MSKGYMVSAHRSVADPNKPTAYLELAVLAIEAAGGKFLSTGAKVVARENGLAQKTVLIECENTRLPSLQIIVKNQEALKALADGSDGDIRLIEGV